MSEDEKIVAASASSCPSPTTVRLVAQRVYKATLLVDNVSRTISIRDGIIVFVCFLSGATDASVQAAVELLLGMKIFTFEFLSKDADEDEEASKKDHSNSSNGRAKATALRDQDRCDVLLIPQATLAGKPKGKAMQYHSQAQKDEGSRLFQLLCDRIRAALAPDQVLITGSLDANGLPVANRKKTAEAESAANSTISAVASRNDDLAAETSGDVVVGDQRYLVQGGNENNNDVAQHQHRRWVLNGTYGNRQGLCFESPGPFTHVLEI